MILDNNYEGLNIIKINHDKSFNFFPTLIINLGLNFFLKKKQTYNIFL